MSVKCELRDGGVVVPVRVRAGARRTGLAGEHDGALRIDVSAAPEKGKANRAVAAVLAELFRVPTSAVQLVSGAASARKRFLIGRIDQDAAAALLEAALSAG